jgi:IS30 family transposase
LRPLPIGAEKSPGLFSHPRHTWQSGSSENTNELLRQFLPKGTDLSQQSQRDLDTIAKRMIDRPRKTLGRRTPAKAVAEEMAKSVTVGT